jgi:hypothetical protein
MDKWAFMYKILSFQDNITSNLPKKIKSLILSGAIDELRYNSVETQKAVFYSAVSDILEDMKLRSPSFIKMVANLKKF